MPLGLDGASIDQVERLADGTHRVHLATADERARVFPVRGVFVIGVKGSAVARPRELPYGEGGLESRRHTHHWWRREPGRPRRSC
ncbi:hypothetical protein ACGFY9_40400 [Streptomyces sp. NPDC048504]|uniref:hypothetical protein n=1 Tax=Streptomyces sp. NPDC048504 TaxID=3365559 RepID=UPI0037202D95